MALAVPLGTPPPITEADPDHGDLLIRWANHRNIAEELNEQELARIGSLVLEEYRIDDLSRGEWKEKYEKWLKFALQVSERKTYPWPGAANIVYPLMTTATLQFAARAYPAVLKDRNVVKAVLSGDRITDEQKDLADRIAGYMSWQLLEEMADWDADTDKLLHTLPIPGCMFRKTYFDPMMQCNISETVSALQICINYKAKSMSRAPRITEELEIYPYEIRDNIRAGIWLDKVYEIGQPQISNDPDAPVKFLEQHRRLDLDDDGYAEPYIVTVEAQTGMVARIVAGYDPDTILYGPDGHVRKIDAVPYYTKFDFFPNPEGGIYGVGFGQLLHPINEAVNTTLNQMIDAGHLQNTGGGFIGKNLSINTGMIRFQPGMYVPVNAAGSAIRDSVLPLPFPGPSNTLFQLLGLLIEAGKDIAAVKDVLMGDQAAANMAPTTVLALIEQGMQLYSAIYKRIFRQLKSEYAKLYRLNRLFMPDQARYRVGDEWRNVTRADFAKGGGVEPASDPTMISNMQKLGRANFLLQFVGNPMVNGLEIMRRVFDAASVERPGDLLVTHPQTPPQIALKQMELQIRAAKEAADLTLRGEHDKALRMRELAQAILFMAQAKQADANIDLAVADQQLENLRFQLDVLTADTSGSPAGLGSGAPGAPPGTPGGAVQQLAAPSGQPTGPGVPQ